MAWTKGQLVDSAFEEIGYASYNFDLKPEQLQGALEKLDAMMARWSGKGLKLNYPLPGEKDGSSLTDSSNLPDAANEAVYLNLAILIAPMVGKSASQDTRAGAKKAYKDVSTFASFIPERQWPSKTPAGEGNKPYRYTRDPFLPRPKISNNAGASNR